MFNLHLVNGMLNLGLRHHHQGIPGVFIHSCALL